MTFSLKVATALLIGTISALSQTPIQNFYGAGGSYNFNAQPNIAGTALYAHHITNTGTYAFTVIDVLPNTVKPFTITNNIGVGLAQKMFTFGKASLIMPTTAGISWSGTNTGWQWTGGGGVMVQVKDSFYVMPTVRFLKSSVSGGSGYEPILGVLFCWGK